MTRISREQMFMDICDIIAKRSTCGRQNVGAILTHHNRIISIGYNGPPSGEPHCKGKACELTPSGGCSRSIHAEDNLLNFVQANDKRGLKLYVTLSPCVNCAQKIIDSRSVIALYYRQEYRIRDGLELLIKSGIPVFRVTTAGHVINVATNEFITQPEM